MTRRSLRVRLLVAWAVFITVTLQVAGIGLRVLFERSITRRTQTELEADLRQLRRGMEIASNGAITIVRAPTDPQFDIVLGGRYWQISENREALLRSRSLDGDTLMLPEHLDVGEAGRQFWMPGPLKERLCAVVYNHVLPSADGGEGRVLTIVTAVDAAEIREDTDKFSADLFSSLVGLAILLLMGAWAHVTIGLRPLEALRSKVASVREGKARKIEGDYPDEVVALVSETNALLDAQEEALRAARERAGDLAHGLKTPLAIMATKSRLLRRQGEEALAQDIDRQIELMRRHVERELARARARGALRSGQAPVDAARLMRDLVGAIQELPRGQTLAWTIDLPRSLTLGVDADDFNNMMGNLVENAQKWATARVRISGRRTEEGAEFCVEDDGPGVPEDQIERVLLRGEKADSSSAGSGLGLAIVRDLVDSYGGALRLGRSELGGLKAVVLLAQ